jgi:putative phage-type endonuclease
MIEQGSPEWKAMRLGRATASRVSDIIARTKTGWGASRANYAAELIAERLTGVPADSYVNGSMQWGIDKEADARAAYEFMVDAEVVPASFVPHPTIADAGASPDGYVGDDGLVEIKCPNTATHLETLRSQAVPGKYATQMQFQMACTGRQWCDFVSFDPRLPEPMQLFVKRIARDAVVIADLEQEVVAFLQDIDRQCREFRKQYGLEKAA